MAAIAIRISSSPLIHHTLVISVKALSQILEHMEGLSALKTIYASKSPTHTKPPWRMACLGLNVESKCQNSHCQAFASRVRCLKGFGVFNVGEAAQCPICHQGTLATRMGLIGCQWMIEGDDTSMWRESSCDEYQRFGLEGARQRSLVVTTRALPSLQVNDIKLDAENCAESFETLNLTTSKLRDSMEA